MFPEEIQECGTIDQLDNQTRRNEQALLDPMLAILQEAIKSKSELS